MTKMSDREIQIVNLYARQKEMGKKFAKDRAFRAEQATLATIGMRYLEEIAERHPGEWAVMFPADA